MTVPTAPAKAKLVIEGGSEVEFLFNPSELTITKSASWSANEAKGKDAPTLRFSGGHTRRAATGSVVVPRSTTRATSRRADRTMRK